MSYIDRIQSRTRLIGLVLSSGALFTFVIAVGILNSGHHNVALASGNGANTNTRGLIPVQGAASQSSDQTAPAATSPPAVSVPNTTTPKPQPVGEPSATIPFSKSAFVAAANTSISNYLQISNLLKFDGTTSDSMKTADINQAVTLERQAIAQVTDLRSQLVMANITSGTYMDLTELAESGAADIGSGVTFAGYWASDHAQTDDLSIGLDGVNKGAGEFVQLSQRLADL